MNGKPCQNTHISIILSVLYLRNDPTNLNVSLHSLSRKLQQR